MKQSTLFLKIAVIMIGLPVIILMTVLWVEIGITAIQAALDDLTLGYVITGILTGMTLTLIPFYAAVVQTYKLITYIDHKEVFSYLAVTALKKIKRFSFIISGFYIVMLPLIAIVAQWDDAPGLMIVGVLPAFASFIIATFAAVLERLLEEAITIKSENDLTV